MKFDWFNAQAANDFGISLAQIFMDRMPQDIKKTEKKFTVKIKDILIKMILEVDKFKSKEKLNFYKKAKLANSFKWTLKDAGYDDAYVEELTDWLIKKI